MEYLGHKIEMKPIDIQLYYLNQAVGIRRFVWNRFVGYFGTRKTWCKEEGIMYLHVLKTHYPWIKNVSSRISRSVVDDFDASMKKFFSKKGGFPRFKKKGVHDVFSIREKEKFNVVDKRLRIERLKTRIKLKQRLRFEGEPRQVTISKRAGRWFASILVKGQFRIDCPARKPSVGIDLGVKAFAVFSDGQVFENEHFLKAKLKKLARKQRQLAHKKRGSNRYKKLKAQIAELHYFIACKRDAFLHKLTTSICRTYQVICIEDLSVQNMLKNRRLSLALSELGLYKFRNMLEYKAKRYGRQLVIADRFFPSTKTCSSCGQKQEMPLDKRVFKCHDCNTVLDRDLNAARNLA